MEPRALHVAACSGALPPNNSLVRVLLDAGWDIIVRLKVMSGAARREARGEDDYQVAGSVWRRGVVGQWHNPRWLPIWALHVEYNIKDLGGSRRSII